MLSHLVGSLDGPRFLFNIVSYQEKIKIKEFSLLCALISELCDERPLLALRDTPLGPLTTTLSPPTPGIMPMARVSDYHLTGKEALSRPSSSALLQRFSLLP